MNPKQLTAFRDIISPNCARATYMLTQAVENQLAQPAKFFLHLHLAICRPCRRYRHNLLFLKIAFTKYLPQIEMVSSQTLSPEGRTRIKTKLRQLSGGA